MGFYYRNFDVVKCVLHEVTQPDSCGLWDHSLLLILAPSYPIVQYSEGRLEVPILLLAYDDVSLTLQDKRLLSCAGGFSVFGKIVVKDTY